MTKTVYLELQEIRANLDAILFSIAQLEDWLNKEEQAQQNRDDAEDAITI